jgi:hypothetical protein
LSSSPEILSSTWFGLLERLSTEYFYLTLRSFSFPDLQFGFLLFSLSISFLNSLFVSSIVFLISFSCLFVSSLSSFSCCLYPLWVHLVVSLHPR